MVSRLRTLQRTQKLTSASGDREAGRKLFFGEARCADCHSVNGKGGLIAADLSHYGNTHSADDLRQQILDHNKEGQREWTKVVTRNGKEYLGVVRNEDNFSLQLQTRNGDFLFFEKASLAAIKSQGQPSAPVDEKDLNNLLACLSQGSASSH